MATLLLSAASAVHAASCSVSAPNLNFGTYNPLSGTPLDSTTTITVSCARTDNVVTIAFGETVNYTLALSSGSGTYTNRQMSSGANVMNYNLYTTSGRTTVWGDGSGSTVTQGGTFNFAAGLTSPPPQTAIHTAFGRIGAGQDVGAGSYTTGLPITVTLTF